MALIHSSLLKAGSLSFRRWSSRFCDRKDILGIHCLHSLRCHLVTTGATVTASKQSSSKLSKNVLKRKRKEQKEKDQVWRAFTGFYSEIFSDDRWGTLLPSLEQPTRHCALLNQFFMDPSTTTDERMKVFNLLLPDAVPLESSELPILVHERGIRFPPPWKLRDMDTGILPFYPMDASSLLPVLCLDVESHHRVLDVCSAPGGKALAIMMLCRASDQSKHPPKLSSLSNGSTTALHVPDMLVCNNNSPTRRFRLQEVLDQYVPAHLRRRHIQVLGTDMGRKLNDDFQTLMFDRVLVDAPCMAERHFLHHNRSCRNKEQHIWSVNRMKLNAKRQVRLLQNATQLTLPGGRIVYSTCAMNPIENDGVVETLLATQEGWDAVDPLDASAREFPIAAEKTRYGWHILPDVSDGWGPMYFSVLEKRNSRNGSKNL